MLDTDEKGKWGSFTVTIIVMAIIVGVLVFLLTQFLVVNDTKSQVYLTLITLIIPIGLRGTIKSLHNYLSFVCPNSFIEGDKIRVDLLSALTVVGIYFYAFLLLSANEFDMVSTTISGVIIAVILLVTTTVAFTERTKKINQQNKDTNESN